MKNLAHKTRQELEDLCSCSEDVMDGETPMCEACQVVGAIDAGIPRSVIAGKTKLTDHFSKDYINWKSGNE